MIVINGYIIVLLVLFAFVVYRYFHKYKISIFLTTLPLLLFIKLGEDLIEKELSVFDTMIYVYLTKIITKDMTIFMKFITFLGSGMMLIIISLIAILVLWKNNRFSYYGYMIAVNLTTSSTLNETFKLIFHRPRPNILRLVQAGGFSFPSGHSMTSLCFYGFIIYLCVKFIKTRWKYLMVGALTVLVLLIGISRIYLGVHYASDVLAGFSAGSAWLVIFITLIERIYQQRSYVHSKQES